MREIKLTLVVPIDIPDEVKLDEAQMQKKINDMLHDWNDGRYPFSIEALRHAICNVVSIAVSTDYPNKAERVYFGSEDFVSCLVSKENFFLEI